MDAQYPFASREDIWRVHEEVKDLFATQMEHGERLAKLERRREDDTRIKNLWGPFSPFPCAVGTPAPQDHSFPSPAEPFKGFDQGHHHALPNHVHMEHEEESKRGASRANSVRFDESSMHGYYSQANRSTSELVPARTGSGFGSHPLTERSLSHRSEGRQSSSGQSHRTYSLGHDASRAEGSTVVSAATSHRPPLTPPPGLFILGPVPAIIRCWLTTTFSNDSLLYAAVCTGAYSSAITSRMVRKLGLSDQVAEVDAKQTIKLPVHLPEASVYQSSSRSGSPTPQVPALTVRFLVHDTMDDGDEKAIQIFVGSDVLRAHNADILFSQDKILIVDDDRNQISVPLVRPEDHAAFRTLCTGPQWNVSSLRRTGTSDSETVGRGVTSNEDTASQRASPTPRRFPKSMLTLRTSSDSFDGSSHHARAPRSARYADESDDNSSDHVQPRSAAPASERTFEKSSVKMEGGAGVWGPWRRETSTTTATTTGGTSNSGTITTGNASVTATSTASTTSKAEASPYLAAASQRPTRPRNMKVLKPTRQMSGGVTSTPLQSATAATASDPWPSAAPSGTHRAVQSTSSNSSAVGNGVTSGGASVGGNQTENSRTSADGGSRPNPKPARSTNPIGGASAFGWLNSSNSNKQGNDPSQE